MFTLNETNVFRVCCAPVNTRQGILRLPQLVRSDDLNTSEGDVYVCFNRPHNRIKMLSIGTPWLYRLPQTDGTGLLGCTPHAQRKFEHFGH